MVKCLANLFIHITNILTVKRNATIEICQVIHVVHNQELHELTMTRILCKASELFEFINFVYQTY